MTVNAKLAYMQPSPRASNSRYQRNQSTLNSGRKYLMSTQQQTTTTSQAVSANEYTLTDDQGSTQIVFFPNRPGPILQGQPANGPELTYSGPEGASTFFSDKIEIQSGALGSLISVILGPIEIFGGVENFLRFTLVLPPVNMGDTKKQSFHTFGVKTQTTSGGASEGAQLKYTVVPLKGLAEIVILPV
jgi:hypothetical protein